MLIAGMIITITASIFYSIAKSYLQILIITLYNSLATGSFNQVSMSTVSDLAPPDQQGDALGRYLTFLGLGMLIGPAMCSILVDFMSYGELFLLSALFPAIGLGLLLLYPSEAPKRYSERSENQEISTVKALKMIFRNRNVMLLSYCRASFSTSQAIFLALFSIYAVEKLGIKESTLALLFTVRGLSNTISRFPAGRISDSIGRRIPMLVSYGLLVVSFTIIAFSESVTMLGVALVLYGLCWGTRAVSEWAFLTDLVEPNIKTLSISYLSSVFGFGSTLGSIAAGWLATLFPYSTLFLLGAVLNLGTIPAILAMKKRG
jgi:predicted MFS family arabinose efflux permease